MRLLEIIFAGLLCASGLWCSPVFAADQMQTITENECARLPDAEIIWHLSEVRWLCCIPKNEDEYETCIPISDLAPLSKNRLNPFPQDPHRSIKPENLKK